MTNPRRITGEDPALDVRARGLGLNHAEVVKPVTPDLDDHVTRVLQAKGLPLGYADTVRANVEKALIDEAIREASQSIKATQAAATSDWFPPEDDVERFVNGTAEDGPTLFPRTDGACLLYPGRVNMFVGRRGAGKTWLAIRAAASVLHAGGTVVYFDLEDTQQAWRERFKTIGVDIDTYYRQGRIRWVGSTGSPLAVKDDLVTYAGKFTLVVFDVTNRLIARLGGNPDSGNSEILRLYDELFDPIAACGAAVLLLDHPSKKGQQSENPSMHDLSPVGGAMKMNNASGLVIGMDPVQPFTRDNPEGFAELICMKDRSGHFAEGAVIAELRGSRGNEHPMNLDILPPSEDTVTVKATPQSDLDKTKARILTLLAKGPMTRGKLGEGITRRLRPHIDDALDALLAEQQIALENRTYTLIVDDEAMPAPE